MSSASHRSSSRDLSAFELKVIADFLAAAQDYVGHSCNDSFAPPTQENRQVFEEALRHSAKGDVLDESSASLITKNAAGQNEIRPPLRGTRRRLRFCQNWKGRGRARDRVTITRDVSRRMPPVGLGMLSVCGDEQPDRWIAPQVRRCAWRSRKGQIVLPRARIGRRSFEARYAPNLDRECHADGDTARWPRRNRG